MQNSKIPKALCCFRIAPSWGAGGRFKSVKIFNRRSERADREVGKSVGGYIVYPISTRRPRKDKNRLVLSGLPHLGCSIVIRKFRNFTHVRIFSWAVTCFMSVKPRARRRKRAIRRVGKSVDDQVINTPCIIAIRITNPNPTKDKT